MQQSKASDIPKENPETFDQKVKVSGNTISRLTQEVYYSKCSHHTPSPYFLLTKSLMLLQCSPLQFTLLIVTKNAVVIFSGC